MTQTSWSAKRKRLYRQARHQAMQSQMKQDLSFDAEGNWVGEESPHDIKRYWENLTDTERAFEKLQRSDAAVFMEFHERIMNSIPKPHVAP